MFRIVAFSLAGWLLVSVTLALLGQDRLLDFLANKVLWSLLAGGLVLETYNLLFHNSVPNIRTAPAIRRKIIALLQEDQAAKGGGSYTVIDLGSGNGLFTREIAAALPGGKVIGIELARQSVRWARFRQRRARLDNLTYRQGDFLAADLSAADALVMYLVPGLLYRLSRKLHAAARPGTLIVSNRFPLSDGWVPSEQLKVKTRYLHQGELYVYRR